MTTCLLLMVVVLVVASSQRAESQPTTGDDGQTSSEEGELLRQQLTNLQSYVETLTKNQLQLSLNLQQRQSISDMCHGESLYKIFTCLLQRWTVFWMSVK